MLSIAGNITSLRTLVHEDHKSIFEWKNNSELNYLILAHPVPFTLEMAKDWVERNCNDKNQILFGIIENGQPDKLIGIVRLMFIDWINRNTELGIFIADKNSKRKGLGKEAMELILRYAFADLNLNRVSLRVASDNLIAAKLYQQIGFIQEGVFRQQVWRRGQYFDVTLMGILRNEYLSKHG